jgi:hypothetical protein
MLPRKALWRLLVVGGMAVAAVVLGYIGLSRDLSLQAVPSLPGSPARPPDDATIRW